MISYIDTEKVSDIATELNSAADDLDAELGSLFKRLMEVPTVSKEWTGEQSETYFAGTEIDKRGCDQLVQQIRSISQELANEASNIDATVQQNNTDD